MSNTVRYLLCDYVGASSGIVYGKKGEKVNIVLISGDMATVKKEDEIFQLKVDKLTDVAPIVEEKTEAVQVTTAPNKTITREPVTRKKAAPIKSQSTLF